MNGAVFLDGWSGKNQDLDLLHPIDNLHLNPGPGSDPLCLGLPLKCSALKPSTVEPRAWSDATSVA